MTLFFLSIWCVDRKFIDAVNYIHRLLGIIHWWFRGLQWLRFRWRFMDQQWHSVFDNYIRQPLLYFCYRFDVSVVNSLTLSIPYVGCHSVFIDDFKVYSDSVFAGDLWITRDIAFLTVQWVCYDFIFATDSMRRSSIHWRCLFYTSIVIQYSLTISSSIWTLFSLTIYGSVVT
jgi:hypothetical protein